MVVYYCAAYWCNARSNKDRTLSYFSFPKDDIRLGLWTYYVTNGSTIPFEPNYNSRLCSKHFHNFQFLINPEIAASVGFASCNLRLKDTAIPTIAPDKTNKQIYSSIQENNKDEMSSSNDKTSQKKEGYQFSCDIDLDDLIGSAIADLCDLDTSPEAMAWDNKVKKVQGEIKLEERRQRDITRILTDCHSKLDVFRDTLEETLREEDAKLSAAEEASKQPHEITIVDTDDETDDKDQADTHHNVDDDDDDVQFIQKTYDPTVAIKRQGELLKAANSQAQAKPTEPQSPSTSQTRASLADALNSAGTTTQQPRRTVDSARQAFQASLNKTAGVNLNHNNPPLYQYQMEQQQQQQQQQPKHMSASELLKQLATPLSSPVTAPSPSFQAHPMPSATNAALNALQRKPGTVGPYFASSQANQERMEKLFLEDVNKTEEGGNVLSRRYGDVWEKAVVMEIMGQYKDAAERKYRVKFQDGKKSSKVSKLCTSRQTAFSDSINKPVTVGTRIVALYKDDETDEAFYAGIVAEAPNGRNELRYLVFFDDGYAQYCSSREIHKVFYQSKNVWDDIHPDSQDFVKDYLAQYPERPMVRLHKGQTVKTEWKGRWWVAKVEEVDASLVLMFFPADKRSEWIYRGSTRLEPLYTALANAEANRNAGKVKRHNLTMSGSKKPIVEYTRNNSTDSSPGKADKKKNAVAKKSTTLNTGQIWEAPWMKKQIKPDKKPSLTPTPQDKYTTSTISSGGNNNNSSSGSSSSSTTNRDIKGSKDIASVLQERLTATEDAGTVDLESLGTRLDQLLPMKDRVKKKIVAHKCGPVCLKDVVENSEKFKGNNPLLIPLFSGWERHVAKAKPSGRRYIFYRAPCGRRLRTIEELDQYLANTNCSLAIDNFCYDIELHVHYEFIPVKTFCDIKDISYGKEYVPISCVNGIDRQYPDYVDYSNQRIPASGVKLNLEPEFLVCCDCTDNCRDRSKCACQQLTVESSAVINGGKPIPDAGFHQRRLPEPILSGVYECNARCKCDKRCSNRVVQNGLSNRLQVFKTEKRGWGLRCLDDIPRGGFICIYAGQLLTDQGANEDGQQYGDEYLAELDYIEVVERQKEGYESDVEDIDDIGTKDDEESDYSEDGGGAGSDSDDNFKADLPGAGEPLPERSHLTRRKSQIEAKVRLEKYGDKKERKKNNQTDISSQSSTSSQNGGSHDRKRQTAQKSTAQKSTSNWAGKSASDLDLPDLEVKSPDNRKQLKSPEPRDGNTNKRRTGRSTAARYGNMNPSKQGKDGKEQEEAETDDSFHGPSTRDFYNDDQSCYIMDAKSMGNIGRYLNHSCFPCAFVQNVFVDTHDLRFPWIAFFAGQYISAGTELTWDYNYEVGSVPGKVLYCYCGSADCRGRLL